MAKENKKLLVGLIMDEMAIKNMFSGMVNVK
jgi:hypothetical protein